MKWSVGFVVDSIGDVSGSIMVVIFVVVSLLILIIVY